MKKIICLVGLIIGFNSMKAHPLDTIIDDNIEKQQLQLLNANTFITIIDNKIVLKNQMQLFSNRQPLIILDGLPITHFDKQQMLEGKNPVVLNRGNGYQYAEIDKIWVMRPQEARSQYGEAGRNGVIFINTKSNKNKTLFRSSLNVTQSFLSPNSLYDFSENPSLDQKQQTLFSNGYYQEYQYRFTKLLKNKNGEFNRGNLFGSLEYDYLKDIVPDVCDKNFNGFIGANLNLNDWNNTNSILFPSKVNFLVNLFRHQENYLQDIGRQDHEILQDFFLNDSALVYNPLDTLYFNIPRINIEFGNGLNLNYSRVNLLGTSSEIYDRLLSTNLIVSTPNFITTKSNLSLAGEFNTDLFRFINKKRHKRDAVRYYAGIETLKSIATYTRSNYFGIDLSWQQRFFLNARWDNWQTNIGTFSTRTRRPTLHATYLFLPTKVYDYWKIRFSYQNATDEYATLASCEWASNIEFFNSRLKINALQRWNFFDLSFSERIRTDFGAFGIVNEPLTKTIHTRHSELYINAEIIRQPNKDFIWETGFLFQTTQSKITNLATIDDAFVGFHYLSPLNTGNDEYLAVMGLEGETGAQIVTYELDIATEAGDVINIPYSIDKEELRIKSRNNIYPDFSIQWSNYISLKNLLISFLLDYQKGGYTWNGTSWLSNNHSSFEKYIQSTTGLKIRELAISYDFKLPTNSKITALRTTISCSNIIVYSDYRGIDYEGLLGLEQFEMPRKKAYNINFNIQF